MRSRARRLPLQLLPAALALLAAPAACLRPGDDAVVTPRGAVLQTSRGPKDRTAAAKLQASSSQHGDSGGTAAPDVSGAAAPNSSDAAQNNSTGVAATDPENPWVNPIPGSHFKSSCDELYSALKDEEACNLDDFLQKTWIVAMEVDCQLNKVESVLTIVSHRFYQASKAQSDTWKVRNDIMWGDDNTTASTGRPTSPEAATLRCKRPKTSTEQSVERVDENFDHDWCKLEACPAQCTRCMGQMHFDSRAGRLIMLPQPYNPPLATSYSYDTLNSETHILNSTAEVTHFQVDKINKGLWFATVLGNENFKENEDLYFSSGVQSSLRYLGNDPAIVMELGQTAKKSWSMCIGGPNSNVIDKGNLARYFSVARNPSTSEAVDPNLTTSFWEAPDPVSFRAAAAKAVFDENSMPMGSLRVDINISALAGRYLDEGRIASDAYSAIIDSKGFIMIMSNHSLTTLFEKKTTLNDLLGTAFQQRCSNRMTKKQLRHCSWTAIPKALSLSKAMSMSRYKASNISGVLPKMFDGTSNCSDGMQKAMVHSPHAEEGAEKWHYVSFCAFSAVPNWGLIVGTGVKRLATAARFSINAAKKLYDDKEVNVSDMEDRISATLTLSLPNEDTRINKVMTFVIRNDGRVALPWVARLPAVNTSKEGEFFMGLSMLTEAGELKPGEEQTVEVLATINWVTGERHVQRTESIIVRPDEKEKFGACHREEFVIRITVDMTQKLTMVSYILRNYGKRVLAALIGMCLLACIVPVGIGARNEFRRKVAHDQAQTLKVKEAQNSTSTVCFPMVLVSAKSFARLGRLVSHEELQAMHEDVWLYTVEEVKAFSEAQKIIFISHQWTAFASPDPTKKQYEAMLMSIETLRKQENWTLDEIYIWVDYSSIPQKHRGTQTLAINSLTTYASNVAAFVVVAPSVEHQDLGDICDKQTYQRRTWCRAEQLSHLLAEGDSRMFLAESGVLTRLSEIPDWLEQSKFVFHGDLTCCRRKHQGMKGCDKELLVIPMLGLWSQLCERCETNPTDALAATKAKILENLDEVFPRDFDFQRPDGGTEKRMLFGDLTDRLAEAMSSKLSEPSA